MKLNGDEILSIEFFVATLVRLDIVPNNATAIWVQEDLLDYWSYKDEPKKLNMLKTMHDHFRPRAMPNIKVKYIDGL